MIFLSAQPDEYYFLWQLQLQIFNFVRLGIKKESIHILIGYDKERGLSKYFQEFQLEHPGVNIYDYPDTRTSKVYPSSIRPHIIAKHFTMFPELQNETMFYHDSDILFSSLPDFSTLNSDNIWYCSDTRGYLNSSYIKQTVSDEVFKEACDAVGISPILVESDDDNAGGAQYILKNVPVQFWRKIEKDCTDIFEIFETSNSKNGYCKKHHCDTGIQSWCADMWAIWWNALFFNTPFKISSELDFSWAASPIDEWTRKKILHYTGSAKKEDRSIFRKANYSKYPPFHDDLTEISESSCSFPLKQLIDSFNYERRQKRIDLTDFSFLLAVRILSDDHLENLYAVVKNLTINYNTNIIIVEADKSARISAHLLPKDVEYCFFLDDTSSFHATRYNNYAISKAGTKFIVLFDNDCVILSEKQMLQAVSILREGIASIVSPYDGNLLRVDILLKSLFLYLYDAELLEANSNKMKSFSKRSLAGMIMVNKESFVSAGGDNEYIISQGAQVMERIKRMQILGFNLKRIPGNLYCLPPAEKNEDKAFDGYEESMKEYLKICSLTQKELMAYVGTWT